MSEEKRDLFKVGNFFLSNQYGLGQVIHLSLDGTKAVIDFKGRIVEFEIGKETQYLKKIPNTSILVQKYLNADLLKNRIKDTPILVLKEILQEYKKISEEEIKNIVCDLVDEDFSVWWKKQRALLRKEKDVKISGGKVKVFEIAEEISDEEYILQFEKGNIHQKLKIIEDVKLKKPTLYNLLLKNLKEKIDKINEPERWDAVFYLVDAKEIKKEELSYMLDKKSIDEIWDIMFKIKSNKYKKNLFLYILSSVKKEEQISLITEKEIEDDLFECFLKQREDILDVFNYFSENYKMYPEKYLLLLKYLIDKSPSFLAGKDIWEKALWILYYFPNLRKYRKILSSVSQDEIGRIKEEEALVYKEYVEKIFEDDKDMKFKIKRKMHETYPNLLFYEEEIIYSTSKSILKREEELNYIKTYEIPENAEAIARARAEGDLSENFEYQAAKDKHNFLFSKVNQITRELQNTFAIEEFDKHPEKITLGNKVVLKNVDETKEFTILGVWDTSPDDGIISYRSQIAGMLLGKKVGEEVALDGKKYIICDVLPYADGP